MSRVVSLFRPGGPPMSCPPDPLLLLHDAGELPADIAEGWTEASLRDHVGACRRCRRVLAGWQRSIDSYRALDPIDPGSFDDAFFEDLAREVDEALGRSPAPVVPLRRRPAIPPMAWAAAAVLVLALALGRLLPSEGVPVADVGESPDLAVEPVAAVEAPPASAEEALRIEAQALGRSWLDDALEEELPVADEAQAMAASAADVYPFATSLYDELDELSRDELASLFTQL